MDEYIAVKVVTRCGTQLKQTQKDQKKHTLVHITELQTMCSPLVSMGGWWSAHCNRTSSDRIKGGQPYA